MLLQGGSRWRHIAKRPILWLTKLARMKQGTLRGSLIQPVLAYRYCNILLSMDEVYDIIDSPILFSIEPEQEQSAAEQVSLIYVGL